MSLEKSAVRFVEYEWNHYNTILILLVMLLTIEAWLTGYLEILLNSLGNYGYFGGLAAGFLFTYGITTPFAMASFIVLADSLDIWTLTLAGTIGGLFSEYLIYRFAQNEADKTLKMCKKKGLKLPKINSKILKIISPLVAGVIIASPLPDEFAAVLLERKDTG
jgi:hypothetical protein